jgi:DNA invertase Pin-like site-specific DNA recombinase
MPPQIHIRDLRGLEIFIKRFHRMREAGLSISAIARELEVSRTTVRKRLNKWAAHGGSMPS